MPALTTALRNEYQQLFDSCQILPERQSLLNQMTQQLRTGEARYRGVSDPLGIPWYVVAVLHAMEGGSDFKRHLHNGDPLTARTVQVPAGRPKLGAPPFTWEQSANDALRLDKYDSWTDWSVPGILYKWEGYNGWGYRSYHPECKTPYLWSMSNHYSRGKYVADGTWSPTAVSKQVGAAALLRRVAELGLMSAASFTPTDKDAKLAEALAKSGGALRYSPAKILPGALELQQFLNRFPGIFLREDGKLGERSSDAYKQVFGHYLQGDPRGG